VEQVELAVERGEARLRRREAREVVARRS